MLKNINYTFLPTFANFLSKKSVFVLQFDRNMLSYMQDSIGVLEKSRWQFPITHAQKSC